MKKTTISSFDDLTLSPEMRRAITELGFTEPTPIQQETLPILMKEHTDFLGLAATGTGKTAAFAIPLLEKLDHRVKGVQALILCPTRELAKQTSEQINLLARYQKTKALAIYGGADYAGQLRALKDGVSVVVGTPGRIIDHLERGTLSLNHLKTVVLDEADEMISMGFKEDIELILEKVSQDEKHQTWLFSATMSREVRKIADQFLYQPKQIQINKTEVITTAVKQYYYLLQEHEKMATLEKIIDQVPEFYGLIFCQTKALVVDLTSYLRTAGYAVDCLHGDMDQNARERALKGFKAKHTNIVVCTDVASRGIDVKELTHVINYSLPRELDLYVHRIGRTGRGGKEGIALSLVTSSHQNLVYRIEKTTLSKMTKIPVPKDSDLLQAKLARSLKEFEEPATSGALSVEALKTALDLSPWKAALENLTKEEILAKFLIQTLKLKADKQETERREYRAPREGGGGFRSEGAGKKRAGRFDRYERERSGGRREPRQAPVPSNGKSFLKAGAKDAPRPRIEPRA